MAADNAADSMVTSQSSAPTCTSCNKAITAKCLALKCSACGSLCHMTCFVNNYVATNGCDKPKNSLAWLADFLQGNFFFVCSKCTAVSGIPQPVFPKSQLQQDNILSDIASVKQSVHELDNKIAGMLTSFDALRSELNKTAGINVLSTASCDQSIQKSFAQVASQDIVKAVQSALSDSLRTKDSDRRAGASIMIYGLPESNKSDVIKVRRLLEDDIQSVIHVQRLGKPASAQTATDGQPSRPPKPRPIRVELRSAEDKNWVLSNAALLIRAYGDANIHISKYFTAKEMEKVKALRDECAQLNKSSASLRAGKPKYLVIDDKIMERLNNGKLERYTLSPSARSLDGSQHQVSSSRSLQAKGVKQSGDTASSSSNTSQPTTGNGDKKSQSANTSSLTSPPKNVRRGSKVAP